MKTIGSFTVPDNTKALLWDMDGVLIDSMSLDAPLTNRVLEKYLGKRAVLTEEYIKSIYTWPWPEYWALVFKKLDTDLGINLEKVLKEAIVSEFMQVRLEYPFKVFPDALMVLDIAKTMAIKNAVVSNNPTEQVKKLLSRAGIVDRFDAIVGNDSAPTIKSKPAPDMYLLASKKIGVKPQECVVVEDSVIGAQAGKAAGCYVIGVSTGALSKDSLVAASQWFDSIY